MGSFLIALGGAENRKCGGEIEEAELNNSWVPVKLKYDGRFTECYVNFNDGSPSAITVTTQGFSLTPYITKITIQDIIDWFNGVDENTLDVSGLHSAGYSDNTDSDDTRCYDGSGPLGWILCPIIKAVSRIGEKLWEYIENTFLVIPVEVFETDGGVYQAWDTIRNIANVIFIILFLVVIFSQLTGVGIDNYGIKKILPRLIMVAILVNLSWIICELLADVSNITGSGITDMLKTFASQVATSSKSENAQLLVGSFGATVFGGGAGALFVLLNGWNLAGLAALGLAVLGIVITLVLGILTMFVILIVREAGVILMIVLAPVAIVCYALPNTEKLSKKWFDIFKALLVVYPLCGAALGAGKLASAVLASIGGSETAGVLAAINGGDFAVLGNTVFAALTSNGRAGLVIAAMVAQVLPFFFIPTLLRNSLSLMGNIGARISQAGRNLGRRASTGLQRGVQNSERFKDFQKYQQDQTAVRRAQRIRSRYTDRNGNKLAGLSQREEDRLAKAQDVINAENQRRARASVGVFNVDEELAENRAQSSRDAQEFKASQDEFAGYDQAKLREVANLAGDWLENPGGQQRMSALIGAMEANGMQKDIYEMLRRNPSVGNKTSVMQALAGSKDKVLRAYGKKGLNMSYDEFMTNGAMKQYVSEKGSEFLDGLDDKALSQVRAYSTKDNEIMSTGLLAQASATIRSQDAINEVNEMLKNRDDVSITGEQLANINYSTYSALLENGENGYNAIQRAYNDVLKNNPQLLSKMDVDVANDLKRYFGSSDGGFDVPHGS